MCHSDTTDDHSAAAVPQLSVTKLRPHQSHSLPPSRTDDVISVLHPCCRLLFVFTLGLPAAPATAAPAAIKPLLLVQKITCLQPASGCDLGRTHAMGVPAAAICTALAADGVCCRCWVLHERLGCIQPGEGGSPCCCLGLVCSCRCWLPKHDMAYAAGCESVVWQEVLTRCACLIAGADNTLYRASFCMLSVGCIVHCAQCHQRSTAGS